MTAGLPDACRAKIKALTRSKQRLQVAFGDYIDSYEATVGVCPCLQDLSAGCSGACEPACCQLTPSNVQTAEILAAADNTEVVQRCLADVKTVICTGAVGSLPAAAASLKLPHLVLLASAGVDSDWGLTYLTSCWHQAMMMNYPRF